MDYTQILARKFPGAEWTLDGDSYEGLTWLSETPKPSQAELEALWSDVEAEIVAEQQARRDAKASAIAKLEALGLTVDEVSVAFGLEAE
jgi:hypothetical protein